VRPSERSQTGEPPIGLREKTNPNCCSGCFLVAGQTNPPVAADRSPGTAPPRAKRTQWGNTSAGRVLFKFQRSPGGSSGDESKAGVLRKLSLRFWPTRAAVRGKFTKSFDPKSLAARHLAASKKSDNSSDLLRRSPLLHADYMSDSARFGAKSGCRAFASDGDDRGWPPGKHLIDPPPQPNAPVEI
jgi:hypothetical protein